MCKQVAALPDQLLEGRAMNILHDEKILAELLNKVIDGYSIGMGKLGSRSGFTPEAFNGSQIILVQGPQDFDRDQAFHPVIPGFKNTSHTACGNMFTNLVSPCNQCAFILTQCSTSTVYLHVGFNGNTLKCDSATLLAQLVLRTQQGRKAVPIAGKTTRDGPMQLQSIRS